MELLLPSLWAHEMICHRSLGSHFSRQRCNLTVFHSGTNPDLETPVITTEQMYNTLRKTVALCFHSSQCTSMGQEAAGASSHINHQPACFKGPNHALGVP